jgi:phosphoribosylamine---glycine ligase
MNLLLVGGGGREHALAWKIAQSPLVTRLVAAPGSVGIAEVAEIRDIAATDVPALVALAQEIAADLVVAGPETALAEGLADALAAVNIPCFGPSRAAARLETSKGFAKALARDNALPIGDFAIFTDASAAHAHIEATPGPYVVKADGLAAGKGVVIAATRAEARAAVDDALGGRFGAAGASVLIEEFLEGEIISIFALSDGVTARLFGVSQDHKRAFDGETGPNTGGMGTYAPVPSISEATVQATLHRLIEPAFAALARAGTPYRGVIFCEAMVTRDGPKLIEFNVRFGDPECQVLMLRLESDLVPYLLACAKGGLADLPDPVWRDEAAVCVVMAARGYPGEPETGTVIRGLEGPFAPGVQIFHAGVKRRADGAFVAAGGRVLNVCARGPDLAAARDKAYAAVDAIDWPESFHRRDIGWRNL